MIKMDLVIVEHIVLLVLILRHIIVILKLRECREKNKNLQRVVKFLNNKYFLLIAKQNDKIAKINSLINELKKYKVAFSLQTALKGDTMIDENIEDNKGANS